jgi:hypothetical protein
MKRAHFQVTVFPMPDLGPEASILISFAILFKDTAICFKAPRFYNGIMSGRASNLLAAVINGCPVN